VSLLAEVAASYVTLRGAQRELAITQSNAAAQRETLNLQEQRFSAGLTNELTVAQARAQVENTESSLPALDVPIRQSIHRLSVLVGEPPAALAEELLSPQPIPHGPAVVPAGLPSELLLRRPDIRRAERELAAATANIGVATAELFPKITLDGTLGLRSDAIDSLFQSGSGYWSIGPGVSWNILNWIAVLENIEVQNARQEQALLTYRKTVLEALEDVENALVAYRQEQERRDRLFKATEANRHALDLAQQLYDAGLADFLNVLTAQRAVFQSEDELVQSERAVSINLIALYKALGGGWEIAEAMSDAPPQPQAVGDSSEAKAPAT
jgi:NodT family efflux transporter outer membrane factor (OMF) lipoprotein